MTVTRACLLVVLGCAIALAAGCASRRPAPVIDRAPAPVAQPAAPAATPAPAPQPETYLVKRGDTLYSIALDQGVDWRDLMAWNQLSDPTRLRVGQALVVRPPAPAPAPGGPVVVSPVAPSQPIAGRPLGADAPGAPPAPPGPTPGTGVLGTGALKTEPKGVRLPYSDENLAALQRSDGARAAVPGPAPAATPTPKTEPPPVARVEPAPTPKPEPDGSDDRVDWSWPTGGRVVGDFNGAGNKGVDIGGRVGDAVFASAAGRVVYSGEGIPAYGKLVIIRHNGTYLSAYAHNSQILVKEGQSVSRGQKIAELGATGTGTAKLHFEIRRLGKPVDPLQYLPSRPN
jgi:lipoprotein NlpD